jgi:flagellar biosynthesis GTPase FlhF
LRYIKTAVLAIAVVLLAGVLAPSAHAQVSFDLAYSNLSQDGTWLISAQYGHVWQPREYNRDWNPYYDGHWVYTDMGWTWVSDYSWGAIPYHYGTWVADSEAGWVWIPGHVWAPSWVVFRTDSNYIGWAPVPPGYAVGMSFDMGNSSNFVFVSSHDFLAPRIRTSIIPMARTSVFVNNTTVVNNIVIQNNVVVNRGPDYRTVERATGSTIHEERIENVARVAPFEHVSRAQLAVDPVRVKSGVRVAEPVPASQPLPMSSKPAPPVRDNSSADAVKPPNGHPFVRPNTQEPATPPLQVIPSGAADDSMKTRPPQTPPRKDSPGGQPGAEAQPDAAQSAKDQANAKANANQSAKDQASAKANADQSAKDHANAKANANQSAKDQASAKANADQSAKDHANAKANADQSAKDQANAKASADQSAKDQANAKASADPSTPAEAKAKAKADAKAKKAKKQEPAKPPAQSPGTETTPGTKDEAPR